jgi:hypothetical protein
MLACSNCPTEALYRYKVTADFGLTFCFTCLPTFLKAPQYSGRVVKLSDEVRPVIAETPAPKKRSSKKKAEEPVEVEEPVIDEPAEEPVKELPLDDSAEETVEETDGTD